jgi:hypothetical protein
MNTAPDKPDAKGPLFSHMLLRCFQSDPAADEVSSAILACARPSGAAFMSAPLRALDPPARQMRAIVQRALTQPFAIDGFWPKSSDDGVLKPRRLG